MIQKCKKDVLLLILIFFMVIYILQSFSEDTGVETQIIILGNNTMRSQYPPKPAVKILKRPNRNEQEGQLTNDDKPKQPIKSLKQVCL